MAKLWAGRTGENTAKIADDFNASIAVDCRMYRQDITGSMAHAAMLAARNIISQADATGFINLFGLPIKVQAQVDKKNGKQ